MNETDSIELVEAAHAQGIDRIVVGGLLWNDGILLIRRRQDDFLGGLWEIPSGKLNHGETLLEALGREVAEETGQIIEPKVQHISYFDYLSRSGKSTRQFNFLTTVPRWSEITLVEHDAYQFTRRDAELNRLNVSSELFKVLREFLSSFASSSLKGES